jgi:hypothetical protein
MVLTVDREADAYKLFSLNSNYAVTTLYRYHAGKIDMVRLLRMIRMDLQ